MSLKRFQRKDGMPNTNSHDRLKRWWMWAESVIPEHAAALYACMERQYVDNPVPYHNVEHMRAVANIAMRIYYSIYMPGKVANTQAKLLFLAASFHDFNHAGRKDVPDSENIAKAIEAFRTFYQSVEPNNHDFTIEYVSNLIAVTEYPFIKEPVTLTEMIIRDADLLMVSEPDAHAFIEGLDEELERPTKTSIKDISKWLEEQTFYTVTGKEIFQDATCRLGLNPWVVNKL